MIQVENPLAVLTQDTARMFLSSSSPQEKYGVRYSTIMQVVSKRNGSKTAKG